MTIDRTNSFKKLIEWNGVQTLDEKILMNNISIKLCVANDIDKIRNLLNYYKLITQDIDLNKQLFMKVIIDNEIVAIGSLETHQSYGLLRSIAVEPNYLENGYASRLCDELKQLALQKNITELYLLTETAESFFSKQGFQTIEIANVPELIKQTSEFSSLCPDNAAVMWKTITPLT